MKKRKVLVLLLSFVLIILLIILLSDTQNSFSNVEITKIISLKPFKTEGLIDSDVKIVEVKEKKEQKKDENIDDNANTNDVEIITEQVAIPEESKEEVAREEVYDGMTMQELASKLERSMKNELSGYGYLYASYSLEKGVDPYLALAISLEETGCNWNCSNLVRSCNNVGGMKGSGCGSYGAWSTLDEGIRAFIDNIYRNYVLYGLTTADTMNPKYAENPEWSGNVNAYITRIRNS